MIVLKSLVLDNGVQQSENLRTGEFFGVKSALARMPRTETASVACDSVVLQFTVPEFEQIFSAKLDIIEKMLRVFSNSLRLIHQQTEKIFNIAGIWTIMDRYDSIDHALKTTGALK